MTIRTVVQFGNVPPGTKLILTAQQASARLHALTVEKAAVDDKRGTYIADQSLGFKAGEEIGVVGDMDRGLQQMFGISPDNAKRAAAERKLAAATATLREAQTADANAKKALASADEAGKPRAEKAAKTAATALERAQAAFAKAGGTLDA